MSGPVGAFVLDNATLWGAERMVLPWIVDRLPEAQGRALGAGLFPATAIGILRDGRIVGGVAFSMFFDHPDGGDCQVYAAIEPGARVTRSTWRHLYGYPFRQLGCRRATLMVGRKNRAARRHAVRAGWKLEGTIREAEGRSDLMMYGLLRSEMRPDGLPPLRKVRRHG